MNYLRHSPLLSWIAIVALLGALLATSYTVGEGAKAPARFRSTILSPHDVSSIQRLNAEVTTSAIDLGTGASLHAIGESVTATAQAAAAYREGVAGTDGLVLAYRAVAQSGVAMAALGTHSTKAQRWRVALTLASRVNGVIAHSGR